MNCIHCQGAMRRSTAPFNIDRNGYHVVFDSVPAWICRQCGEPYFEEREVDVIQGRSAFWMNGLVRSCKEGDSLATQAG